mmetsp:Transcript_8390/g.25188  ORF Transcript_8390/g.25188 Transcript_8390/m.25188 type:complete len:420 (-) Transcript_8390:214-1473(-)
MVAITAEAMQITDYCVLAVSGVCILLCLACAAYAVPWTVAMREARAVRRFNRLWQARVLLEVVAALWLWWVLLRMLALWGVRTRPGLASNRTSQQLCRIFLGFSLGLLQPLFLLLTVLLCHTSIAPGRRNAEGRTWGAVAGWALLGTAPMTAVQVTLAWFSQIFASRRWDERKSSLPGYFFAVYFEGDAVQCLADRPGCIVCVFPASMIIVSGIFNVAFLITLWVVSSRVAATTVNRRLLRRMRTLEIGMAVLVPGSLAVLGASVSTNPFNVTWQTLIAAYSCCCCAMAVLASWMLVAVPVYVAKAADRHIWQEGYGDEDPLVGRVPSLDPPQEMALLGVPAGRSRVGRTLSTDASSEASSEDVGSGGGRLANGSSSMGESNGQHGSRFGGMGGQLLGSSSTEGPNGSRRLLLQPLPMP